MIKIGIVFDAVFGLTNIIAGAVKKCSSYVKHEDEFEICLYESWKSFLHALEQGDVFHLVYIDVLMKDSLYSPETADAILSFLPDALLVYIHSTNDFQNELDDTKKFSFMKLSMPVYDSDFDELFTSAYDVITSNNTAAQDN